MSPVQPATQLPAVVTLPRSVNVTSNRQSGLHVGLADVVRGFETINIWWLLARQDISMRYRRSLIGPFWISISLAAMVIGLSILYAQIFRIEFKDYLVYLSVGLFAWNYISVSINESCTALLDGEGMLRAFPVSITGLGIRMMLRNFIILLHNAVTILVVLLIFRVPITWSALNIFSGLAVYAVFPVLLACALGPICMRFRDLSQVITNVVAITFFLTPIIWKPEQVGERVAFVTYNPIYHLIELTRAPILGTKVEAFTWAFVAITLAVCLMASIVTLSITRRRVFFWL